MPYLDLTDISLPDKNTDLNWWADHIEFLCFVSQDSIVTVQQLCDRLLDENANVGASALESVLDADELDAWEAEMEFDTQQDGEVADDALAENVARDGLAARVQNYFNTLGQRQRIY